MKNKQFDFGGWATKNDLLCADGRTIRKDAFKDDDGRTVPLVWQHNHDDPTRVIGHALLENKEDGVYAYCSFNNSELGQHVRELVRHGDVRSLSIYANQLKQHGGDVVHGVIREVSVVLAGANPGAIIEFPMLAHGEEATDEAVIWSGDDIELDDDLAHAENDENDSESEEELAHADDKESEKGEDEETIQDVLDSMNEKQRKVVEYLVGQALESAEEEKAEHDGMEDEENLSHSDDEENDESKEADDAESENEEETKEEASEEEVEHSDNEGEEFTMKKNLFDNDTANEKEENTLTHAQLDTLIRDAKRLGSFRASILEHGDDDEPIHVPATYGIDHIDYLMPEYKEIGNAAPQFIKRDQTWVAKVMQGVHHIPFSKFKTTFADITSDEARARGYITGHRKTEEVFTLLRRTTDATTVYKKQKMDRDNALEITSFDVIAWLKSEMRMMLDEELARAFLVGDGRDPSSDDKINELNIRPVLRDDALFVVRQELDPTGDLIDAVTYGWENYQGSGNCVAFMTRHTYSGLKLMKDKMGRRIYETDSAIASALGVREVIFVPQMGDATSVRVSGNKTYKPLVIIMDLSDYTVGADKGGSINMFEDFDIDYNQMKYLIETRCSGALVKPYSAIVVEEEVNP